MLSRAQTLVWILAVSPVLAGCRCSVAPDGRKYFHHGEPLAAVEAFAYASSVYDLQFLSDLVWVDEGEVVELDACAEIRGWIYASDRSLARVEVSSDAARARVDLAIRPELRDELGREAAAVVLRSELKVEGTTVWLVDIPATLAPSPADLAAHD